MDIPHISMTPQRQAEWLQDIAENKKKYLNAITHALKFAQEYKERDQLQEAVSLLRLASEWYSELTPAEAADVPPVQKLEETAMRLEERLTKRSAAKNVDDSIQRETT